MGRCVCSESNWSWLTRDAVSVVVGAYKSFNVFFIYSVDFCLFKCAIYKAEFNRSWSNESSIYMLSTI